MALLKKFPELKPLGPPPELADLTGDERDAWLWMTSGAAFDATLINITSALARLMLTRVGENRKLKPATVARYQAAMSRGQWKLTHQGIAISTRFEVIDGQHRLHAVIGAGAAVEMLVVRGISQDAMLVIDNAPGRTDPEAISISDIGLRDLQRDEASCAKRMIRGSRQYKRPASREDLRTFIIRHRQPIKLVCGLLREERVPNVTNNETAAVLARASYHCSREDLISAAAFLTSGKSDGDRFEPLLMLREWLVKNPPRDQLRQRYGRAERALRAFIQNEKIGRRLVEAREELFALPEEHGDAE